MAQLTEHFDEHELGVEGCDQRHLDNAKFLCEQILEPIRARFGPVHVHDGYRDPGHNASVGGKTASFHLFTGGHAAADIDALPAVSIPALFDWLRLESGLPFDKVILETNAKNVPACVHVQVDMAGKPRRQAFIGHTGAATHYEDQVSSSCRNPNATRARRRRLDTLRVPFPGVPAPLAGLALQRFAVSIAPVQACHSRLPFLFFRVVILEALRPDLHLHIFIRQRGRFFSAFPRRPSAPRRRSTRLSNLGGFSPPARPSPGMPF